MTSDSSEPDVPPMRMVALPRKHMAARLDEFEERLVESETQTDRGRRQRKLMWIAFAGLSVVLLLALGLIVYLLVGRSDSRRYYNQQIQMLVCSVPPTDSARQAIREQAHCPPFQGPSSSSRAAASSQLAPSSSRTVTGEARLATPSASRRQPSDTATSPRSGASRPAAGTRTVTVPGPAPRSTLTAPKTASPAVRTSTPAPASAPVEGLLPGLLCILLGCR